jgi:putative ABC transport system ATP-binding protein
MNRPAIILADEPFGNLDHEIGSRLGDLLFSIRQEEGTSLVIVTHDPALARRADRTLVLDQGRLEDRKPVEEEN